MKYIPRRQKIKIIKEYIRLFKRNNYTTISIMRCPVKDLLNRIDKIQSPEHFIYESSDE